MNKSRFINNLPRLKDIIIIIIMIMFFSFVILLDINIGCIFKKITNIACPGCGLTRSFKAILNFDFISAIKFNILGIPLFILSIISVFCLFIDAIRNKDNYINFLFKIFSKYYFSIIILLVITMIIGNINKI